MKQLALLCLVACGSSHKSNAPAAPADPAPGGESSDTDSAGSPDSWDSAGADDAAPAEATPPARAPAKGASLAADAQAFIVAHNAARAKHCAPPLTWSNKLAMIAQKWADTLKAKGCAFGHSGGQDYGENLAAGSIGALDPSRTVAMWYDEVQKYKFPDGGFSMDTGHFTQLVWTTTTEVGCGHVQCKGNDIYVCNYSPPGNWEGQYREHVLPASCRKR